MTRRCRAALLLALAPALLGCAAMSEDPPRVDTGKAVARDLALLHAFALEAQERPGVVCVQAELDQDGLPSLRPGSVSVFTVTDPLPAPDRDALVRSLAEEVWDLGLSEVTRLTMSAGTADADGETSSSVGQVLGGPDDGQSADATDLETAFGPPAPPATEAPPDPGPRTC